MKIPSPQELIEFKQLFDEFKDWKEEKKTECVASHIVRQLVEGLKQDDPMRLHAARLVRYNRYIDLRTLCAPYFFQSIDINTWSLICFYEEQVAANPRYFEESSPKPTKVLA